MSSPLFYNPSLIKENKKFPSKNQNSVNFNESIDLTEEEEREIQLIDNKK